MDIDKLKMIIEGRVFSDEETLADLRTDFGRIINMVPGAVAVPASSRDVQRIVGLASQEGWKVGIRGAAHSQSGQSLSRGGLVLDMTSLNRIETLEHGSIWVQAGALWSDVVRETIERGLVPPVLTQNLNVTVGGTISVGGLGAASFRHGTQAGNVLELEAVTGEGHLVRCSESTNAEFFYALLGGLGQAGVITRVRLKLRKCASHVRTYFLLYDDLRQLMRDQELLVREQRFDFIESAAAPCSQGLRRIGETHLEFAEWFYPIQLSIEHSGNAPNDDVLLDGLRFYRKVLIEDRPSLEHYFRMEPLFIRWRQSGAWSMPHPWTDVLLPWSTAAPYIEGVLKSFPPHLLTEGQVLLYPAQVGQSESPLFRRPRGKLIMSFGLHPTVQRQFLPMVLPMLRKASDLCADVGGKRYLAGWLEFDHYAWKAHFDEWWSSLVGWKRFYDPSDVLNSGLIKFAEPERQT